MMVTGGNGKTKLLLKLASITLGLLASMIAFVLFVTFWDFHPIVFKDLRLESEVVKRGEIINYTSHYDKYTNRVGIATRFLVPDDTKYATVVIGPNNLADSPKGMNQSKTIANEIPDSAAPGKYHIRLVVRFDYFGIRHIQASAKTACFWVVK